MAKRTTNDKMSDKFKNNFEKVKLGIQKKRELAENKMVEEIKHSYETQNIVDAWDIHNVQFLNFSINNTEYAIELKYVNEIVRYSGAIKIPKSKGCLEGIINLRDQIIPVVNVGYFLNEVEFTPNDNSRLIIITVNKILYGLLVNKVSQVLNIPSNSIKSFQQCGKVKNENLLMGIVNHNNSERITLLLNASKFGFVA
ncbi:MAG TPA: chemotaxis protein CheW [Pseudobacteroides sp.]|uniref:chemotaxis protein CheW n=1 Tax=Pseudobacteroides sp. TaxID=1968840 RepID=UPI002F92CEE0